MNGSESLCGRTRQAGLSGDPPLSCSHSSANSLLSADVAVIREFAPSMPSLAPADAIYLVQADVQQPITCPAQFVETHRYVCHSFMGNDC